MRTTQNAKALGRKKENAMVTDTSNMASYIAIGIGFGLLLVASAMNDFLFFGWLTMSAFIVFALMGIHFIGKKQVKRN